MVIVKNLAKKKKWKKHIEAKPTNKCNACDKSFKTGRDLENHIEANHEEKTYTYCDKLFVGKQEFINHMKECIDLGVANKNCNRCHEIVTIQGLKRHSKVCTGPYKEFYCPDCGEQCSSIKNVKKHQSKEHTWETSQSKEVCKHWRKGHCWKGTSCKLSMLGARKKLQSPQTKPPQEEFQPAGMASCAIGSGKDPAASSIQGWGSRSLGQTETVARRPGARQSTRARIDQTETKPNPVINLDKFFADLMADARKSSTAPSSTRCRIFPYFRGGETS